MTLRCNLSCEKCCVRVVEYKKKYMPTYEFLKLQIDKIYEVADVINYFSVEGGEPLLHKNLADVLRHTLKYKDRIGIELPLITNGSIMFGDELIHALSEFGVKAHVIIDDYGKKNSPHVKDIANVMAESGIRCSIKDYANNLYYGGWVDLYDDYALKHTKEESLELFAKCAWSQKLRGPLEIIGGMVFYCPPCRMNYERGVDTSDGYVDLLDESISRDEKRDKIRGWYSMKGLTACMYCNGIHDDSKRYTPAKQLTPEQLVNVCTNEFVYREE